MLSIGFLTVCLVQGWCVFTAGVGVFAAPDACVACDGNAGGCCSYPCLSSQDSFPL